MIKSEKFNILPAIDLKDGKCVRLINGNYDDKRVYSSSPLDMAKIYLESGFKSVHIVDLDGARGEGQKNAQIIEEICKKVSIKIQVGGGIRDFETAKKWLNLGVQNVILGTIAIKNFDILLSLEESFPNQISVGLDVKGDKIAISGWEEDGQIKDSDFIKEKLNNLNLASIIFTDISKDGMLEGPNFQKTQFVQSISKNPVILSGGIANINDVKKAKEIGLNGAIIGRAIYEGMINLQDLSALL